MAAVPVRRTAISTLCTRCLRLDEKVVLIMLCLLKFIQFFFFFFLVGGLLNVIRRWLNNASGALRRRAGFCAPARSLAGFAYKKKGGADLTLSFRELLHQNGFRPIL